MPRRFITAEDIRRVGSGELVVESQTVVTPQALDAARSVGVVLKGANGGTFEQPAPDRGPDAGRALVASDARA